MPLSDTDFVHWTKHDNADRVVLVQLDYMYESSGTASLGTLYLGTKYYTDNAQSPAIRYRACLDAKSSLMFARALTGPTLGNYQSSLGSIEINNENGEYDFLLKLAIDNSEVRVYLGALSWAFSDFRRLFAAMSVRADSNDTKRISVTLKDASALLNRSVGGEVLVGGAGNSAQKYRPANIGLVYQVPCDVLDPVTLQYVHSDRGGSGGAAIQLYDRGVEVDFADNGDGTANLTFPPDGQVTADVLAVSNSSPIDPTLRKISDAFFMIVGDRCGFDSSGRYTGAGPTYTVGDADDYPMGLSITSAQNVAKILLPQIAQSGNCFWTILRGGSFSFGRLQPQDIAGLGLTPVKIRKDDIDDGTLKAAKVADPSYYRLQCLINKNWYVASDVAAVVDQDRQSLLRSEGLVQQQGEAVGTTYADAPQLYDLSLAVSPVLETLITVDPADSPDPATVATTWMERQRFMYLPWLEGITFRCGIEFFELELGDVVELTIDRFGCDAGELFQVIAVSMLPVLGKMELTLLRRLTAEPIPDDWVRVTVPPDLSFRGATISRPPVQPPASNPDDNSQGGSGDGGLPPGISTGSFVPMTPLTPLTGRYVRRQHFPGQVQSIGEFNQTVASDASGTLFAVGVPTTASDPSSSNPGRIDVYKRSGSSWSPLTSLTHSDVDTNTLGWTVSIADDGTIAATQLVGGRLHVFTQTGPSTWSHQLIRDHATNAAFAQAAINRDGDVIAYVESAGDPQFYIYKLSGGTWSLQQTVVSVSVFSCDISRDGTVIVTSEGVAPGDSTLRVCSYVSNPGRTIWTRSADVQPVTSGSPRVFTGQQIRIAKDTKDWVVVTAPDDNNFADGTDGAVIVLHGSGLAQQFYARTEAHPTNHTLGIASADVADDGSRMFVGAPFTTATADFDENGRLWYTKVPLSALGGSTYIKSNPNVFGEITNPYARNTNHQLFSDAIACSADGFYVAVASGDFDLLGTSDTIDFFEWVVPTNTADAVASGTSSAAATGYADVETVGTASGSATVSAAPVSAGIGQVQLPEGGYLDSSTGNQAQSPEGGYLNEN